jgi:hypothetical protein
MKLKGDLRIKVVNEEFNDGMDNLYKNLLTVMIENFEKIKASENAGKLLDTNSTPILPSKLGVSGNILARSSK